VAASDKAAPAAAATPEAAPAEAQKPADAVEPAEQLAALPVPAEAQPAQKPSAADGTPLIPRLVLFGNPDKASARLSHDGSKLSYLAPKDGVLNVFVGPVDKPDEAKPVTNDTQRGIRSYSWAYDNQHILYIQDSKGDEDWHVYSVDLESGETKDLTPIKGVAAQIEGVSEKFPSEIIVGINDRDPQFHDLYKINIATGDKELLEKNTEFAGYVVDDDFKVRFASKMMPDGSMQYLEPNG
jgi:dipeptidyl aminopeptidase/acylaminoacyl peptidase